MAVLDVTTLQSVKDYARQSALGSSEDTILTQLISAISSEFERFLDRSLLVTSQTERLPAYPSQEFWYLKHFPVGSVTSVTQRGDDSAMDTDDYTLEDGRVLYLSSDFPAAGDRRMVVVYSGGMAADTAAFMAAHPDIVTAANRQVWHEYNRVGSEDANAFNAGDQSIALTGPIMLLQRVKRALKPHRDMHL